MVTVRNLNGNVAPAREAQVITVTKDEITAAKIGRDQMKAAADAQLVPRGEAALAFPADDGFGSDMPSTNAGLAVVQELGVGGSPYIARAHPNGGAWDALQPLGVKEGDLYLAYEGQYERVMPLKMWLVHYSAFQTVMNDQGDILDATADMGAEVSEKTGKKFEEHILAVVVVDLGHRLVPAQVDFRGTLSGAIVQLTREFEKAKDPKFASRGEAYQIAAACPVPWGRVVGTSSTSKRISKSSGRPYYAGTCTVRPAALDQMKRLGAALSDPSYQTLAGEAKEAYRERYEVILSIANKPQ